MTSRSGEPLTPKRARSVPEKEKQDIQARGEGLRSAQRLTLRQMRDGSRGPRRGGKAGDAALAAASVHQLIQELSEQFQVSRQWLGT